LVWPSWLSPKPEGRPPKEGEGQVVILRERDSSPLPGVGVKGGFRGKGPRRGGAKRRSSAGAPLTGTRLPLCPAVFQREAPNGPSPPRPLPPHLPQGGGPASGPHGGPLPLPWVLGPPRGAAPEPPAPGEAFPGAGGPPLLKGYPRGLRVFFAIYGALLAVAPPPGPPSPGAVCAPTPDLRPTIPLQPPSGRPPVCG
jgi:hypothetical protein